MSFITDDFALDYGLTTESAELATSEPKVIRVNSEYVGVLFAIEDGFYSVTDSGLGDVEEYYENCFTELDVISDMVRLYNEKLARKAEYFASKKAKKNYRVSFKEYKAMAERVAKLPKGHNDMWDYVRGFSDFSDFHANFRQRFLNRIESLEG